MKALLTSVGSRGDVQPLLGLAVGLRAAGHEVVLATPPTFAEWIRSLGFEFHPVGFDLLEWSKTQPDLAKTPLHAARVLSAALRDEVPRQFRDLADMVPGSDVVVCTGLQVAAGSLAERWGVPYHFALFVPGLLPSPSHPPCLLPWMTLPKPVNRLAWWGFRKLYDRLLMPGVNEGRHQLGLPPTQVLGDVYIGRDVLLAVDADLSFVPEDIEVPHLVTGSWTLPSEEAVPAEVEDFLASGPPPLFLGFGSIVDADPAGTTKMFVDAVRAVGGRALISRGWAGFAQGSLPEGFLAVGSVPHEKLFPRVAAVVHHGGAGTTQTTARAGVPQFVVPHGADQFYWAHRVHVTGIGPRPIPRTRLTLKTLTAALRQIVSDDSCRERARALGERLRKVDGVANAVQYLERKHLRRAA